MSLLEVTGLSHGFGDKALYKDASFDLYKGEHMGVVGQNGTGKSTLIGILTGEVIPDAGTVHWQPRIQIGHLDQYASVDEASTIRDYLKTAFSSLYLLEKEMHERYDRYAATGDENELALAAESQEKLEALDFYTVDTRVGQVAGGLGLDAIGLEKPMSELSGGQRAKVILAKLLLGQPDIFLLDEPTNFLDREHVTWLASYLSAAENAYIVVSHDFGFLEKISTCICDVEALTIRKYHGKYSEFLGQKQHLREDYIRQYNAQQQKIKTTEAYIRKNIAGVNSRIAKGRRKQLERLDRIAPPAFTAAKPTFHFSEIPLNVQEPLKVKDLEVGYYYSLLPKLNFTVQGLQKLVFTGFNGIGKSTLLKTLVGVIPGLAGGFQFAEPVKIGYYEQELVWPDPGRTPLQLIAEHASAMTEKESRRQLSRCGVDSTHVRQPIGTLSGGEQSKVKLCMLLQYPHNFLILDEPTNHLDAESKESLQSALIQFQGCVILVSHEEAFYRGWADRVIPVESI